MSQVYEVEAAGFRSDSDGMDDRVFWVSASSEAEVERAIRGLGATCTGLLGYDPVFDTIDYDLANKGDLQSFRESLSRFVIASVTLHQLLTFLNDLNAVYAELDRRQPYTSIQNVEETLIAVFSLIRGVETRKKAPIAMDELLIILADTVAVYEAVERHRPNNPFTSIQNVEETLAAIRKWAGVTEKTVVAEVAHAMPAHWRETIEKAIAHLDSVLETAYCECQGDCICDTASIRQTSNELLAMLQQNGVTPTA